MNSSVIDLPIEGMTCAACAARIEKNLNKLPGVRAAVNFANEKARIEFDAAATSPEHLVHSIEKAGFQVVPQSVQLQITGMTCAACSGREFTTVDVPNDGVLHTFTIVTFAAPGIPVPFVAGVIDCGGTSVRANVVNVEPNPEQVHWVDNIHPAPRGKAPREC